MREENRSRREKQIEEAAYQVLIEEGYASASMLKIAKRAQASNETLYNWYGDKLVLFQAIVRRNASQVRQFLEKEIAKNTHPMDCLRATGPVLMELLLGDRAIALNRAAAADPTGELGQAISKMGREFVGPLIVQLLEQARESQELAFDDSAEAFELYMNLLVGDLQIRRAIGARACPSPDEIQARADKAFERFKLLLG